VRLEIEYCPYTLHGYLLRVIRVLFPRGYTVPLLLPLDFSTFYSTFCSSQMASINGIRTFLYVLLWLFAAVLLGLSAQRLHYTTHLPTGDPLNEGRSFYDPIVAELVATTVLTILWVPFVVHIISRNAEYGYVGTFGGEILAELILFVMWLVGAAIATSFWGDLAWCRHFQQCRILTALVAFAWMGFIILFTLLIISLLFAVSNEAFGKPLHGRYDPRASAYGPRRA